MIKKILCCCLIVLCLTGCEPKGKQPLPETPENESSHNEQSGLIVEMPEHEKATTDPDYYEKYGNLENANQVRQDTDAGYDKISSEYGPKDDQAEKDGAEIKKGYDNMKENGKKDILEKQDGLKREIENRAETAKKDAKKVIEEPMTGSQ